MIGLGIFIESDVDWTTEGLHTDVHPIMADGHTEPGHVTVVAG